MCYRTQLMLGEKCIIGEDFMSVGKKLADLLLPLISDKFIVTVAGESGSGKTGISLSLSKYLTEKGIKNLIIQQDDYFIQPPKTNEMKRRENLSDVGIGEVKLGLLQDHLQQIKDGTKEIVKPLVIFNEDKIVKEKISLLGIKVIIVEGTYTSVLNGVDKRIFIDRIYLETEKERKIKAREVQDKFLEKVLEIEHKIISLHKDKADFVINNEFEID